MTVAKERSGVFVIAIRDLYIDNPNEPSLEDDYEPPLGGEMTGLV
jgi:hypothetical protein